MNPSIAYLLGTILAIAGTVFAVICIMPEKKRSSLPNKIFVFIHDLINFRAFWLEQILKVLYVLGTLSCILVGFFLLFSGYKAYGSFVSMAGTGIAYMIAGPIIIRLIFESLMMIIILVRNSEKIKEKICEDSSAPKKDSTKVFDSEEINEQEAERAAKAAAARAARQAAIAPKAQEKATPKYAEAPETAKPVPAAAAAEKISAESNIQTPVAPAENIVKPAVAEAPAQTADENVIKPAVQSVSAQTTNENIIKPAAPVKTVCPVCGKITSAGSKFCPNCGARIF